MEPSKNTPAQTPEEFILAAIMELELLKAYNDGIEEQLILQEVKLHDEKNIVTNDYDAIHGKQVTVIDGLHSEDWDLSQIFKSYFPNLQRCSTLISIYSFMEDVLNGLCHKLEKNNLSPLKLTDLRGSGIDRAKLYLVKVAGLNLLNTEKIWSEIKNIQELRNLIVHRKGKLELGNNSTRQYIQHNKHVTYTKEDKIFLQRKFLPYFLNQIGALFSAFKKTITTK